jgi:hypothetical protein
MKAYQGATLRREVTRGDAERKLEAAIQSIGGKLIKVNWKKKTAHYLDAKGNKRSETIKVTQNE